MRVQQVKEINKFSEDQEQELCKTENVKNMVSLADLCSELSISVATGRNWLKLKKIIPTKEIKHIPFFSQEYIADLKLDIQNGENKTLKSRRNKRYVSGNDIYNSYISENSLNVFPVQSLIDKIKQEKVEITEDILVAILAECAIQLINSKAENSQSVKKTSDFKFLVDDLIAGYRCLNTVKENYPKLFEVRYIYEDGEDILGLLYISLKNVGNRKATGSYYTPTKIVKKLCKRLFSMNDISSEKTVFDPCCGTGNFILQLPRTINSDNVYGNDIDTISVKIARINYALKYGITDKETIYSHIMENDYLMYNSDIKYDFIIGNPPWGYDFTMDKMIALQHKYTSAIGNRIESYDVFVEQAFRNLKQNGVLSFVLPEAFLNVKMHSPIRMLLLKFSSIQFLEFLGNVFDKVQCPCIILQMVYNKKPFDSRGLVVHDGSREYTIQQSRDVSAECFRFYMSDDEYAIIDKIDNIPNKTTLLGRAVFALGIVTGNNKDYISQIKNNDNEMVLKGANLYKFRFRQSDNYIVFKPETFQQIAPIQYYRAKEKLLYRFICNQLVFAYDNKQTLSLNSCNLLIPEIEGLNMKYIMAILNSRTAQFFFKKQFRSVKVLRSHIEQIPIPEIKKEAQDRIIVMVDSILEASKDNDIVSLYDVLDAEIANLYGLTSNEQTFIKNSMNGENLFLF